MRNDELAALEGTAAGVVTRTLAGALDYAFMGALIGGGYVGWATLQFLWNPVRFSWPAFTFVDFLVVGFLAMVTYLWIAWATGGKTLGAAVLGTRVVSASGRRVDPARALLRSVFVTVFPIGMFTCAFTPGSRSVHDVALRTKVIHHFRTRRTPGRPPAHPPTFGEFGT